MEQTKNLRRQIALLFCFYLGFFPCTAQIIMVTTPCEIHLDCSEYTDNLSKEWNVQIPTAKYLQLDYSVNTEWNHDKVEIYAIVAGKDSLLASLSGQKQEGRLYSLAKNGQMKVRFTTDGSNNCSSNNTYSGFRIQISESNSPWILNTSNDKGLRIENLLGSIDIDVNEDNAVFSTDRSRFLFSQSVHLRDGKISNYGTNPLSLQTNGLTRMSIINSGYVGIGTLTPTSTLEVNGNIKAKEIILPNLGNVGEFQWFLFEEIEILKNRLEKQQSQIDKLSERIRSLEAR